MKHKPELGFVGVEAGLLWPVTMLVFPEKFGCIVFGCIWWECCTDGFGLEGVKIAFAVERIFGFGVGIEFVVPVRIFEINNNDNY